LWPRNGISRLPAGFFTQALEHGPSPTEVSADRAPATCHGRLKSRLRPIRGLKRLRSARVISAGLAFLQNIRRGHYEIATHIDPRHRIPQVFIELVLAI
jgi:transposase, IS6 family